MTVIVSFFSEESENKIPILVDLAMKNLVDELDKRTNDKDEQVAERKFFKFDSRPYKADIHGPFKGSPEGSSDQGFRSSILCDVIEIS